MSKPGTFRKFFKLLVRAVLTLLFLVGWGLALLAVHLIVVPAEGTGSGSTESPAGVDWRVVVIPKNQLGVSQTFVDTRDWTAQDAAEHEVLVVRMIEAGKGDFLRHVLNQTVRSRLDDLVATRMQLLAAE